MSRQGKIWIDVWPSWLRRFGCHDFASVPKARHQPNSHVSRNLCKPALSSLTPRMWMIQIPIFQQLLVDYTGLGMLGATERLSLAVRSI